MKRIKIFLLEDNRILRDGIKGRPNAQPDMKVVANSPGNHDSFLRARKAKPNVVLVDLGLRSENCLRLVRTLAKELPEAKVVGMGLIPSQQDIIEFVEAGAAGFILKDATIDDVLGTIRADSTGIKDPAPSADGIAFLACD